MDKRDRKMTAEEVQGLLAFRKKGYAVAPKKGKGSYNRKAKYKNYRDLDKSL